LGSSGGILRVIPSLVPGVELDAASWNTYAGTIDLGTTEGVEYHVTLRSTRDVPDTDIVVVYELRPKDGPPTLLPDARLVLAHTDEVQSLANDPRLHQKGRPRNVLLTSAGEPGLVSGVFSSASGCPVAVRIVPRNLLALYLRAGASLSDTPAALISRLGGGRPNTNNGTLRILDAGDDAGFLGLVVENTTDSVVANMVAAMPVFGDEHADTIEFLIAHVDPGAVVSFTTQAPHFKRVGSPMIYAAASVRGRAIADAGRLHLASRMPRIGEVKFSGGGVIPSGRDARLHAILVTGHGDLIRDYDDMHTEWTVTSTGSSVGLDTTSTAPRDTVSGPPHRYAVLRADGAARAHVTATVGGVTGSIEVTFVDPPGVAPHGPAFDRKGRRVLPDGTIEVENVCVVRPNGSVEYEPWLLPHIAQARADSMDHSPQAEKRRAALVRTLAGCVR
jgi:hypothetical protein